MKKPETYAELKWTANDVKSVAPEDWTLERCEAFLQDNERKIKDRMCELGFEIIENFVSMENAR